jgi:D-arabinose 1-dehydrogenase-like Zn-dependent alcohol dehydrogenase
VVPNIFFACGTCFYCRTNRNPMYPPRRDQGSLTTRGYGEYFRIPATNSSICHPCSVHQGSIIADAVVTSVHGVKGRVRQEAVVVISVGGCSAAAIPDLKPME